MNKTALAILLAAASTAASAKDKPLPLAESIAPTLAGKSVAVVRHPVPDFVAMTPGKAMFALVGAAAMISAGNEIVKSNQIEDPASLLERELAPALAKRYGMTLETGAAPRLVVKETKPAKIAALQTGVDYLLDIRSGGWMSAYYPTSWSTYWLMYSVQVQLIDAKSGQAVANLACNAGNKDDKHPPSKEDLLANGAQLMKDVTQGFGWTCMRLLAKEEFHLAETETNPIPAQYTDVLTQFAAAKQGGAVPAATAVANEAPVAPAAAPEAPVAAEVPAAAPVTETTAAPETAAAPEAEGEAATGGATEAGAPAPAL